MEHHESSSGLRHRRNSQTDASSSGSGSKSLTNTGKGKLTIAKQSDLVLDDQSPISGYQRFEGEDNEEGGRKEEQGRVEKENQFVVHSHQKINGGGEGSSQEISPGADESTGISLLGGRPRASTCPPTASSSKPPSRWSAFQDSAKVSMVSVLDMMPNNFAVKCFAKVLTAKEVNLLKGFEMDCLVPFDKSREGHRSLLEELWYSFHCACARSKFDSRVSTNQDWSNVTSTTTRWGTKERASIILMEDSFRKEVPSPPKDLVGEEWKAWGFQGTDPVTDFRGSGVFGLHNLLYFSETYSITFSQIHQEAQYPVACAGLNITLALLNLLQLTAGKTTCLSLAGKGALSYSIHEARYQLGTLMVGAAVAENTTSMLDSSNMCTLSPTLESVMRHAKAEHKSMQRIFNEVYCVCFVLLHEAWQSSSKNLMEFNTVLKGVRRKFEVLLAASTTLSDFMKNAKLK